MGRKCCICSVAFGPQCFGLVRASDFVLACRDEIDPKEIRETCWGCSERISKIVDSLEDGDINKEFKLAFESLIAIP